MKRFLFAVMILVSNLIFPQNKQDKCLGIWLTQEKNGKIEIYKENNKYKGKIIWAAEPNDEKGKPKVDFRNPDPKLRSRPVMGLELVWGFVFDGDDTWENGKIYDPKSGKTYSAEFTMEGDNLMKLRGYVGITLLGRTTTWTRSR